VLKKVISKFVHVKSGDNNTNTTVAQKGILDFDREVVPMRYPVIEAPKSKTFSRSSRPKQDDKKPKNYP
jgi:hypothetical protein